MNLNFLTQAYRTTASVITANSPQLLTGAAIVGIVSTGILAARGGYKARGIIDEKTAEKGEELTVVEKISATWLCYAVPAVTGASSIASVYGVHAIHNKRNAAMAGLYAAANTQLEQYKDKAEELLGAKKTKELRQHMAQARVDAHGEPNDSEIIFLDEPTELFHDELSGRWFMSSVGKIESAVNETNAILNRDGDVSLNDYYDQIGLPHIKWGEEYGWSGKPLIESTIEAVVTPKGRPALSVGFLKDPRKGFDRLEQ